jgi:predicted DCC family thiol-disulfide oxidoreductase YuxK
MARLLGTDDHRWRSRGVRKEVNSPTIVFFDGVCGLCNRFVDFLVQRDRERVLRYAPLQGRTAAAFAGLPTELDTVAVAHEGRVLVRSDAALLVLRQLGGVWALVRVVSLVPRVLRDAMYDIIARNRYGWFGKHDACRLPTAEEAEWFLP